MGVSVFVKFIRFRVHGSGFRVLGSRFRVQRFSVLDSKTPQLNAPKVYPPKEGAQVRFADPPKIPAGRRKAWKRKS
jgi:hypothetical protein